MHRVIFILIIGSVVFFGFWFINLPVWLSCLLAVCAGLASLIFKKESFDNEGKDLIREVMVLAGHYTTKLRKSILHITAPKTKDYMEQIIHLLLEITKTVKEDPKDAKPASKLLNYYGEVACKLADAHIHLSKIVLDAKEIDDAKNKIDESLGKLVAAIKKQVVNLYEDNFVEIDSEMNILEVTLKNDFDKISGKA